MILRNKYIEMHREQNIKIYLKIYLHGEIFFLVYCLATSGCSMCISNAYFFYSNKICDRDVK